MWDIHFLRKERLYTKLKYSRSPAYDIVSGGFAALFAGLLGFLTSEKFGFELVDSADFYYLFMYGVFAAFALRPFITLFNKSKDPRYVQQQESFIYTLLLRDWLKFYSTIFILICKQVRRITRK